jgi:hypothetical protein
LQSLLYVEVIAALAKNPGRFPTISYKAGIAEFRYC